MRKRFLAASLATIIVLSLTAYGGGKKAAGTAATPTAIEAPADTKAENKAEDTKAEVETAGGKAPENYKGTMVVYSPHDTDPLNAGVSLFTGKYPDVKVEVVAADTGGLYNCITTETANPIVGVLWGRGADSLATFKEYFEPYVCTNNEFVRAAYKGPNGLWISENPLPMVIFYSKDLIERDDLIIPETWEDLTRSGWKDKIAYCLPSESGSAYTQLCTMILGHGGKEDEQDFIKKLYGDLDGKIVDSSDKYHKMVADGEFHVGLILKKTAVQYKDGPSVEFVYPKDGTSTIPDGVALVKGCPSEENARLFTDFVTSKGYQIKRSENWGRRPVRSDMEVDEGIAKLEDIPLVGYGSDQAASEEETIIEHFNGIMAD